MPSSPPLGRGGNARDGDALAMNVDLRDVGTPTADALADEPPWTTLTVTARAYAEGRWVSAARKRRFGALMERLANGGARGVYEAARCPGATSALKRAAADASDAEARRGACAALAAFGKTERGVALLCTTDEGLREAWGGMRRCEWTLALARIKTTFSRSTYAKCWAARVASQTLPFKTAGSLVDGYLSAQKFFPLQPRRCPTFRTETRALDALSKTLANVDDDDEVLYAALRAVDEILLTVTAAREPISSFTALAYTTEQRMKSMTTTGLAALDPVEAFMGNDWVEARRRRGCFSSVFRAIGRMIFRSGGDERDGEDEDDDDDDDANEAEDEEDLMRAAAATDAARVPLSVTESKLDYRLMALSAHPSNAIIREHASRILYEATLSTTSTRLGKRVFRMLVGVDSGLRASAMSWLAYLFTQHLRTTRAFVSIDPKDKWPLTSTVRYLLSEDVLRSAAKGLAEKEESIRLAASRMVRAAWDASAVTPTSTPDEAEAGDAETKEAEMNAHGDAVMVDDRLRFDYDERWLVFVNAGVVSALCDLQLSRSMSASQLADSLLAHFRKTEPAAMRHFLSRKSRPSARETREALREKIDHQKANFGSRRDAAATATTTSGDDKADENTDASRAVAIVEDAADDVDLAVAPHRARWREYSKRRPAMSSAFIRGARRDEDSLEREGWRARAEDYILAGGAPRRTTRTEHGAHETRRGPYERAVVREGGALGVAADALPVVFSKNATVGPYVGDAAGAVSASAQVFTRPSRRHKIGERAGGGRPGNGKR